MPNWNSGARSASRNGSNACSIARSRLRSPHDEIVNHGFADTTSQFPRQADCRRRDRRIGQEYAASAREAISRSAWPSAVLYGMEQRGPRQSADEEGEEEDGADADDLLAAA